MAAEGTVPPTVPFPVGGPEPAPGRHAVAGAVEQPVASDGYWARSSRACKVLAGGVGEVSWVGVVLVISVAQGEPDTRLPEELMQASTVLASVLMSICGTIAVELLGEVE